MLTGALPGSVAGITAALVASVAVGLVIYGGETPGAGFGFLGLLFTVFVTVYRLEWGMYLFVGVVLLIDQFEVPEFDSLTYKINYFNNINIIPYLPRIEPAAFSPMDLHLMLLVVVWLAGFVLKNHVPSRAPSAWPFGVAFVAWMGLGFIAGAGRGGDMTAALWELRGLVYLFVVYSFVPQVIQTPRQIQSLMWVCIVALTFKACEGTSRFIGMGFSLGGHDALLTHEDPVFFITLWIFLLALLLFGARTAQRKGLVWGLVPLLIGFYAANRRAAFASLAVSLLTFAVMIPRDKLLLLLRRSLPFLAAVALYAAVFWGSQSPLAAPLNQIRSGFVDDAEELGERNFYSNLYRKLENYNLAFTIRTYPLAGIGFGTKYFQPLELVKINYALRDYMAHNNILWLLVKVGGVGFVLFWLFVNVFGARGAMVVTALRDPYLKAVGVVVVVAVINQLVAAYFDLHLVRYRTMTYMGVLMGLLPALEAALAKEHALEEQGSATTPGGADTR